MPPTLHIGYEKGLVAENVVVMGDPERLDIFRDMFTEVEDLDTKRGFKAYTGLINGVRMTIASHGIGCPSASIVFEELRQAGARNIIRLGTAGGLRRDAEPGNVVLATGSGTYCNGCCQDMYAPNTCLPGAPDPFLLVRVYEKLRETTLKILLGPVFTSDAFYAETPGLAEELGSRGFIGIDMETHILYTLGWKRGYNALSILVISNNLVSGNKIYLGNEELREIFRIIVGTVARALKSS